MRITLDEELKFLNKELITMGSLCEDAINNAITALLSGDLRFAQNAIAIEQQIDQKEKDIESHCMKLLIKQQPVAKDLRQISAAIKMITDMERIGDQACDISLIITDSNIIISEDVKHIKKMSEATITMVTKSIDAFVKSDLDLAHKVIEYDDVIDDLFQKVKNEIITLISREPTKSEYGLNLLMIAKYLERIGDHATNIAEWVIFAITGIHKGE
ncbi:phosphate signaling complex protein PhoU [Selenomonadales bacterium OttesenSCG-928-I06]|nr:phosphate signaling complex protein PhoU [Selenomonadales bacterium OttesenSCG-928-I06]